MLYSGNKMAIRKRYTVRFYRMVGEGEKRTWFTHEVLGADELTVQWKIHAIIRNHELMGGRIAYTRVMKVEDSPRYRH